MSHPSWPKFEQVATFVLAGLILFASFWGLRTEVEEGTKLVYAGFIGSVLTWLFQRNATKEATQHTIEAQNNGLETIRQTVGRMESGRLPSAAEIADRDRDHKS